MIELCHLCRKQHETGGDVSFGDIPFRVCPEVPVGTLIPLRKIPITLYSPEGDKFETGLFRYELAGPPVVNANAR